MKFSLLFITLFLCLNITLEAQETTIYFQEDFNQDKWGMSIGDSNFCVPELLPDGWFVFDSLNLDYYWHWSLEGPRGHFTNPAAPLEPNNLYLNEELWPFGASIDNGFLMLESDFHNTDTFGNLKPIAHALTSFIQYGPIDLSESEFPIIEFSTVLRRCCNPTEGRNQLLISTDYNEANPESATWKEYNLLATQDELYAKRVQFDISTQVSGQANVYLQFKQMNLSHHLWMIDDLVIYEAPISDVELIDSWFDYIDILDQEDFSTINPSFVFNGGYTKIPQFAADKILQIRAGVKNNGSKTQDVRLNAFLYKDDIEIMSEKSQNTKIEFLESDTIHLPVSFNTIGKGNYQVSVTVESVLADDLYANNSFSYDFEVTNNVYSHVYSENATNFDRGGPADFYIGGQNGDKITQRYEITAKAGMTEFKSLQFYFPSYNEPKDSNELKAIKEKKFSLVAKVFKEDKENKNFPVLPAIIFSEEYTMNITDTGSWVSIPFVDEGNLFVETGVYFVGLEMYIASSSVSNLHFDIGVDNTAPKQMFGGGQVYFTGNGNWYNSYSNYAIELTAKSLNNVNELSQNQFNLYPNPCNSYISISNSEKISKIAIYTMEGKMVFSDAKVEAVINTQNLKKGVYILSIESMNGETISKKLIKQ